MAIAGDDYCVIAADTRQSSGYSINTRYAPKGFALYGGFEEASGRAARGLTRWGAERGRERRRTDRSVLASSGFYGDIIQLNKRLKIRIEVCGKGSGARSFSRARTRADAPVSLCERGCV